MSAPNVNDSIDDTTRGRIRPMMALSATAALVGIALSVSGSEGLGGAVTVGGFVILTWSIHRYGRTGAG